MPNDARLGTILVGRYRLRREIGAGAHGRVYLAEDLGRGGSYAALKIVEDLVGGNRAENADAELRWFRHPNWASVTDSGALAEDATFQALQFVPGRSLDTIEGARPAALVWKLLEDGARVLGALHRQGLIHYDVTPGNWILNDRDGDPVFVLTDGGLAHSGPVSGFARGTPQFMAPEVTEDGGHDHRADLYSLGLVAFRLATGRDPIEGTGADILGRRRREKAPRASTINPDVPEELDRLLADLLARDPNARPHDAFALLQRIADAVEHDVPMISDAEGIAASEGGPLVGHAPTLERYGKSLRVLASRVPSSSGHRVQRPAPQVDDAVLVLHGDPGSGTTRLARELSSLARDEDVPALLISGRESTSDRRGPLRNLVDGLAALALPAGEAAADVTLEQDGLAESGHEEQAHAIGRAVETFIQTVESASRRTPFVLVVEDFADLPIRAREALLALSRDLLSRRESAGGTTALPVILVVDAGSAETEGLLIPDARDPEQPLVHVPPLTRGELLQLCQERFRPYAPDEADVDRIERVSEGLPGVLVSLLGEGCRRRDLRSESGRWLWRVDHLSDYEIERGLSPVEADALRKADPHTLHALQHLSLVEAAVTEPVFRRLMRHGRGGEAVDSSLIRRFARGEETLRAPCSRSVAKTVLSRMTQASQLNAARVILPLLASEDSPDSVLDRVRLMALLDDMGTAIALLGRHWPHLPADMRVAAQPIVRTAIEDGAISLAAPENRTALAELLEPSADSTEAARALAKCLDPELDDVETAERIAQMLESARRHDEALSVLTPFGILPHLGCNERTRLWTRVASLQFDMHQDAAAREALAKARMCMRAMPRSSSERATVRAQYLVVDARGQFLLGRTWRASLCLRAALITTADHPDARLHIQALNNLGIVSQQGGAHAQAREYFEDALRMRQALGDATGAIRTTINLGRLAQFDGELVKSASLFQSAASASLRHAQHLLLSTALRALARVYDQQLNAKLATTTLLRAVQVGRRVSYDLGIALAAWELAPLAAAAGQHKVAGEMLRESARAARKRLTGYARATHQFVSALTQLHWGRRERAALHVRRVAARREDLFLENQRALRAAWPLFAGLLGQAALERSDIAARPAVGERARFSFRAGVWLMRALRRERPLPPLPLSRFTPRLGHRPSAPGRERRLLVEMALFVLSRGPGERSEETAAELDRHLAQTGEACLHSRTLARRSSLDAGVDGPRAAQRFSRSVDLLESASAFPGRQRIELPDEHREATATHVAATASNATLSLSRGTSDLHALAHRLLVLHGCTAPPDGRVASALRRILGATGGINAGVDLDELLEALTRHTIEITGASRACVVLVERENELKVRVAQSSSSSESDLAVEDLSHTVIQRVLASSEPLLLHDVFDDQELMGRPSITSLSLRSILCVPMLKGDSLYGVMYADSSSAAGSFDQVDLEVLSLFAEQAAAALETHRLVTDLQNSMAELKAMQERLVRGERLRTIGELSSGVAHEFNNLLTSILARVQLISLGPLDPELKRDLGMIETACLDAAEVVRRLQTYARNQRQSDFVGLDLRDICRDSVELLRPLWTGRRRHGRPPIRVTLDAPESMPTRGNATELREVLTNLIKNALDALPDGGSILIRARGNAESYSLAVEDDGHGMPPEVQARVFDPFYTTKGERGTGLGLGLSQQIIERHGGQLTIESSPGTGTAIHITLPARVEEQAGRTAAQAEEQQKMSPRVLVVDDDENVLRPLCRYLSSVGYEVLEAGDGEAALRLVLAEKPDVIISDVGMPGMDGLKFCRAVHAQAPHTPVVLMSGWADAADPPRAREAGAVALLSKPFALRDVSELLDAVRAKSA